MIRKPIKLLDAVSAAGASDTLKTDHRFKEVNERCFVADIVNGDYLEIQAKLSEDDASWYTIATLTATATVTDFADVIRGPWPFLRVNKVGTTGAASFYIQG